MDILDLIKSNEVISIIGSGGKTSLIRLISKNLRRDKKVLITNSVDIERIPENEIDFIDYEYRDDYTLINSLENGSYLISTGITNDNLLKELKIFQIDNLVKNFDISLVECDISKNRGIKAWRENEPLIPTTSTLVICVLDVTSIGKIVDVENVYNLDIFMDITNKKVGDIIEENDIVKVITDKRGIFNNLDSRKIIIINRAEDDKTINKAVSLGLKLSDNSIEKIIFGSIKKNEFNEINFNLGI